MRSPGRPELPAVALRRRLLQSAGPLLQPGLRKPDVDVRRVLLMRPDHIGDVLLSSPAVAALRDGLPHARLTYLVGPWSAAVARRGPAVDTIETLAFPGFARRPKAHALEPYAVLAHTAARLRGRNFDLAVVLRPDHWWGALLALASGIPNRVGARTPETIPVLSHACELEPGQHAVEQGIAIARLALQVANASPRSTSGTPTFELTPDARAEAEALWQQFGLGERRVVALQPSAGAPLKSWPPIRWAALGDQLAELDVDVLLTGAPDDDGLLHSISSRMRGRVSVAVGQPLDVSAALYERCALLVAIDGGGAHLAAAVGTPTLRLYGPAAPTVFGPWPTRSDQQVLMTQALACAPCGHLVDPPCGARAQPACLLALGVDDVLESARRLLDHG